MENKKDLTEWENEHVKQIEDVEDRITQNGTLIRVARWLCKHCGNEFVAGVDNVKKGHTISCGCHKRQTSSEMQRETTRKKVFEHGKFGMLTPISFTDDYVDSNDKHRSRILCKCDCGNETVVLATLLLNGSTTSCGCRRRQMASERRREITRRKIFGENKKFGMLTPISFADDYVAPNGQHFSRILCKCGCGKETVVLANNLLKGTTISCGCRKMSIAAQNINDLLLKLHIPFVPELHLPGCYNPSTGVLLPFDFGIFDENKTKVRFLIEYQGEQHYKDAGEFGKLERDITDKIKKDFCIENEIPLYEIRYDEDEIQALKRILKEAL